MKILLLEIPSAYHAYKGWLGGKAIREILDLYNFDHDYKLILNKKYLTESVKDISKFDIIHIECHSDEEGICYNPTQRDYMTWYNLLLRISNKNDLSNKQLIISGCLAGNTDSQARVLANPKRGFKRVFAFAEEIDYDKAIATWSSFYYLISKSKKLSSSEIRPAIKKIRNFFNVELLYFYPSSRSSDGINVYP